MSTTPQQSATAGSVEVGLFGPTTLLIDGVEVELGRRQVRQLVAALACRSGRSISADALIDHLWSNELPANPRKALNVALSRLRSALGPYSSRLQSDDSAYRLVVDSVDIEQFEGLVGQARNAAPRDAAAQMQTALDLWLDEPFSDDVDADFFSARRTSLTELRWFAVTRLIELLNEIGEHNRAVETAVPFLDGAVVRERLVIAHAVALARAGRKADALAAVARAVSQLRDDSGLDPSPALLEAERDILTGGIDLASLGTSAPRPLVGRFVGRRWELAALDCVPEDGAVTVIGEAGMGKSALFDHFVETSANGSIEVLRVDVPSRAEHPLGALSALCSLLALRSGVDSVPTRYHAALSRVSPDLGLVAASGLTRDGMVADLVSFVEDTAAGAVLIIDDAHLLDGISAEVLQQLVGRVRLIFGTRPTDAPSLQFLFGASARAEVGEQQSAAWVPLMLDPLGPADISELLGAATARRASDGLVADLHERSGGNALFLRLLIERWVQGGDIAGELPSSVLVSVSERLQGLSGSSRSTLDAAAAIGRSFSLRVVRELYPNADVELAAAEAAGVLVLDPVADTGTFVHSLVRDVCYDLLPIGRRIELHDEIGRVIEWSGANPAEYAMHHVAAARLDPRRAIASSIAAAAEFANVFDWREALDHVEAAAEVALEFDIDDADTSAQIVVRRGVIGRALNVAGYMEHLFAGCELARVAGNEYLFVVAVTELCGHGKATAAGTVDERVLKLLDEALEFDIGPAERAELCASAVPLFSTSEVPERGRALYREAWRIVQMIDDPEVEAAVLANAHLGFAHPDDFELLVRAAERMAALAGNDPEMIWEAAFITFQCSTIIGDAAAASAALVEMREYAPAVSRRSRDFGLAFSESGHAALCGDLDQAERFADEAFSVGIERFDPSWAVSIYGLLLLGIRVAQGRVAELGDVTSQMVQSAPGFVPFRAAAAFVAAEQRDHEGARQHLDVVAQDDFGRIPKDIGHTSALFVAGIATAVVGTAREIEVVTELLRPYSGRLSWTGAGSLGPIDAALSRLAAAAGDQDGAVRLQRSADDLMARFTSA